VRKQQRCLELFPQIKVNLNTLVVDVDVDVNVNAINPEAILLTN
jgi:hypothetical protein